MIDNTYKNAFKEVYDILENTDKELLNKVPKKFIQFLENNMNKDYKSNIKNDIEINKQNLLRETEAIISLIYRSYWATDEEKKEFSVKDRNENLDIEKRKKQEFKNVEDIFAKRKNINKVTIDNNLMVIQKENFFKRILNKIFSIFKK